MSERLSASKQARQ